MTREYYSVTQTAEQLNVGRSTIHYWILSGKLKAVLVGNQYNISSAEIKRFKESRNNIKEGEER